MCISENIPVKISEIFVERGNVSVEAMVHLAHRLRHGISVTTKNVSGFEQLIEAPTREPTNESSETKLFCLNKNGHTSDPDIRRVRFCLI